MKPATVSSIVLAALVGSIAMHVLTVLYKYVTVALTLPV